MNTLALDSTAAARPPVVTWLIFPATLTAVIAASLALLARSLPPPAVAGSVVVAAIAVISLLERRFPLHRAWNARPGAGELAPVVFEPFIGAGAGAAALGGGGRR